MIYYGKCYCGALGFSYRTELAPADWSIRADQCSFCRAHRASMTSDPDGFVEFHAEDATSLRWYHFGQKTADFLFCGRCAVLVAATIETAKGYFAAVSVNAMLPSLEDLPEPQQVSYESESIEQRRRRREARWTPCEAI